MSSAFDTMSLTRKNKTVTALLFRFTDNMLYECSGAPFFPVFRNSIYTEDHLPGAVFIVHGGILIHPVSKISFISCKTVNKRNEPVPVKKKPEMVSINFKSFVEVFF